MAAASAYPARALRCFSDVALLLPRSLASSVHANLCQSTFTSTTSRSFSNATSEEMLLTNQADGLGKIIINRPKALNAKNCGTLVSVTADFADRKYDLSVLQKW